MKDEDKDYGSPWTITEGPARPLEKIQEPLNSVRENFEGHADPSTHKNI